jgi:hypothetical protein
MKRLIFLILAFIGLGSVYAKSDVVPKEKPFVVYDVGEEVSVEFAVVVYNDITQVSPMGITTVNDGAIVCRSNPPNDVEQAAIQNLTTLTTTASRPQKQKRIRERNNLIPYGLIYRCQFLGS